LTNDKRLTKITTKLTKLILQKGTFVVVRLFVLYVGGGGKMCKMENVSMFNVVVSQLASKREIIDILDIFAALPFTKCNNKV